MKNLKAFSIATIFALAILAMQACSFSTSNLSSLETYKDKDGKDKTSSFKAGDTIYGRATISNKSGKVQVKFSFSNPQGKAMSNGDVSIDLPDNMNVANYTLPTTAAVVPGNYTLTADMINEAGEKKDSKSETVTIAAGADE